MHVSQAQYMLCVLYARIYIEQQVYINLHVHNIER